MAGFFRVVAGSRRRLAISALAGLLPVFAFALLTSDFIRESSTSPSLDLVLITVWMLLAFGAAWLCSLLIGDLVFPRGWREVNVLGQRVQATDEDADLEVVGAAAKKQTVPLAFILVGVLALLVAGTHFATGGFLLWYARYGYATSTLRGDVTSRKVAVLEEMTRAQDDRLIELTRLMYAQMDAPGVEPEVRLQAIWSLGEVGRRMERSIELMAAGEKGGEWVVGLRRYLRETVEPRLLSELSASPAPEQARAIVYGLGSMRTREAFPAFRRYVEDAKHHRDVALAVTLALAGSSPRSGVPILRPLLLGDDPDLIAWAGWSIGEMYGFGLGEAKEELPDPEVVSILARRLPSLPFETQCVLLDAVQKLRAEELDRTLFQLFEQVRPVDRRCPRVELERPFQGPLVVAYEEEMRERLVKALAAIAYDNERVKSWLLLKSKDESIASGLRLDMGHVLDVVRNRQETGRD